jgi:hypothetical protein
MAEKTASDLRKDELFYRQKNGCERVSSEENGRINLY